MNFCMYDLYMSIGPVCRPAFHLKDHFLRVGAFPLDWMMGYSLDTVIHLFYTQFEDFFSDAWENLEKEWTGEHRWVEDRKNGIISIHHFPKEKGIDEYKDEYRRIMRRRFKRCDLLLNSVESVLLLANRGGVQQDLIDFVFAFSNLYPKPRITILNMKDDHRTVSDHSMIHVRLSDKLDLNEYYFNDSNDIMTGKAYDARGNNSIWNDVLLQYAQPDILEQIQKIKESGRKILIYGAGARCRQLLVGCKKYGIPIAGITVTDVTSNPTAIDDIPVRGLECYDGGQILTVISIRDKAGMDYAINAIKDRGMDYITMDDFVKFDDV